MNFILYCMATIGLTNILLDSNLFAPVRDFLQKHLPTKVYEVFECHQCMGFWSGLLTGFILITSNPFQVFLCGCAGSFLSTIGYLLIEYISLKTTSITFDIPGENDEQIHHPM